MVLNTDIFDFQGKSSQIGAGVPAQVKAQVREAHLTLMGLDIEHYSEIMQHYANGV